LGTSFISLFATTLLIINEGYTCHAALIDANHLLVDGMQWFYLISCSYFPIWKNGHYLVWLALLHLFVCCISFVEVKGRSSAAQLRENRGLCTSGTHGARPLVLGPKKNSPPCTSWLPQQWPQPCASALCLASCSCLCQHDLALLFFLSNFILSNGFTCRLLDLL
jgi:hypothetical protein